MTKLNEMFTKYDMISLQNHPANVTQDHLTICAFFDNETEFAAQAAYMQKNIDRYNEK